MDFVVELTAHELTRRACVGQAMDWMEEANTRSAEVLAWKMLYSNLDEHQQQIYRMLVEEGRCYQGEGERSSDVRAVY